MISAMVSGLMGCGIDMPKEVKTSFETMTVEKQDITVPVKFSARLKGQSDVTITPQVSGQLMQIAVSEGQLVRKGQTLFVIDSRNAQLELEAAQANLQAALAQENSAKLNLGFCTITAPVVGVIGEIPVRTGDQVSPGSRLTIVSGNTTMDAEFSVTEALIEASVSAGLTQEDKKKHMADLPDVTTAISTPASRAQSCCHLPRKT